MDKIIHDTCIRLLKEELLPAMGCTEPISIAYGSAFARDVLGAIPEKVEISLSRNILKNIKSVIVPNTNGMVGVRASVSAGIIGGITEKELEAIAYIPEDLIPKIREYADNLNFMLNALDSGCVLDVVITVSKGDSYAKIRIAGEHTNVVHIEKDGEIILDQHVDEVELRESEHILSIENIVQFANEVDLSLVSDLLERQINCNVAIANEGLKGNYGANIGKILLKTEGENLHTVAKAYSAAGSDARMNGCKMPVVIVSGSGNQGMTASLPVIVYAERLKYSHEKLLRALLVSNLVTIHLKSSIGRLSAYCGVISAGCGAGAGICYMTCGDVKKIEETVENAIAIDSGVICDGAKSSCAAKIASAVSSGLLGYEMAMSGNSFSNGDGIIGEDVESTIANVGILASNGMTQTDDEIMKIMLKGKN